MSAADNANRDKVRAHKIGKRAPATWSDIERAFMQRYAIDHPRSKFARSAGANENVSPPAPATRGAARAPSPTSAIHATELLPANVSPATFVASSPPAPATEPDTADTSAETSADTADTRDTAHATPPRAPLFAEPAPTTNEPTPEQREQMEASAAQFGGLMVFIARMGLDSMATLAEMRKAPDSWVSAIKSDRVRQGVEQAAFVSGRACALKYGLTLGPYEHEITCLGILAATATSALAVHELKKKGVTVPADAKDANPREPDDVGAGGPQSSPPMDRSAPIFSILGKS